MFKKIVMTLSVVLFCVSVLVGTGALDALAACSLPHTITADVDDADVFIYCNNKSFVYTLELTWDCVGTPDSIDSEATTGGQSNNILGANCTPDSFTPTGCSGSRDITCYGVLEYEATGRLQTNHSAETDLDDTYFVQNLDWDDCL